MIIIGSCSISCFCTIVYEVQISSTPRTLNTLWSQACQVASLVWLVHPSIRVFAVDSIISNLRPIKLYDDTHSYARAFTPSIQFELSPCQIRTNFKLEQPQHFRDLPNQLLHQRFLNFSVVRFRRLRKKARRRKKGGDEIDFYAAFSWVSYFQSCSSRSIAIHFSTNFLANAVIAIFFLDRLPLNRRLYVSRAQGL